MTKDMPKLKPFQNIDLKNLSGEFWRSVKKYEDLYMISNYGRVKALKVRKKRGRFFQTRPEMILKQKVGSRGYCKVQLSRNKKNKTLNTHRLVALNFIKNPKKKPTVNHKNGIKTDNYVKNLEWATQYEQNHHAIRIGLVDNSGENGSNAKFKNEDIIEIRKSGLSVRELCVKYNHSESNIYRILKRQIWKNI